MNFLQLNKTREFFLGANEMNEKKCYSNML